MFAAVVIMGDDSVSDRKMDKTNRQSLRYDFDVRVSANSKSDINAMTDMVNDACSKIEAESVATDLIISMNGVWGSQPWPNEVTVQDVSRWERALRRFELLNTYIISVISGVCGGPEFELALLGDYRIASPETEMCPPMNDKLFWPGMSLYRLVHQCGLARARQIVLGGRSLDARLCLDSGIFDEIADDPIAAADRARRNKALPSELAIRRRLLLEATFTPYEEAIGTHLAACDRELRRMYAHAYLG